MKKIMLTMVLVMTALLIQAQEVMKVELKKGETVEYKVDEVKRVFFDKHTPVVGNVVVTPQNVTMYYNDTRQLSATNATNWQSENEYVAKVDDTGLVTGRHVGTTQIIASNDANSGICNVVVKPKYELFDTPLLEWGASKTEVKNAETHDFIKETETAIGYNYTFDSNKCVVAYNFKDEKLIATAVALNFTAAMYLSTGYYLIERYQPLTKEGYDYYFMDAMNFDDAKTIIYYTIDTSGSSTTISVVYADKTYLFPASSRSVEKQVDTIQHEQLIRFFESIK